MSWLDQHPEVRNVRCGAADLNGQPRGKRVPVRFARKMEEEGTRFPLSVLNLDIWGEDVEDSPLVFEIGDPDGILQPTERGYVPMPWLSTPSALLPMWMFTEEGDALRRRPAPRAARRGGALHGARAHAGRRDRDGVLPRGRFGAWTCASPPRPARASGGRGPRSCPCARSTPSTAFFNDLYDACDAMDIPAEAAISEVGPRAVRDQPRPRPRRAQGGRRRLAVQDAGARPRPEPRLRRELHGQALRGLRRQRPPHPLQPAWTRRGPTSSPTAPSRGRRSCANAIAGCLKGIPEMTLVFAPHANSYDRLVPESHAPTGICWAYDNRTASVRVPGGDFGARRVEHRVAGGDVNPYLFLAAVLGLGAHRHRGGHGPPAPDRRQRLRAGDGADPRHLGQRHRRLRGDAPSRGASSTPG